MKTTVLDRIKLRMEELGMAPEAVSKKAGLDRSYLRRLFDRGASPRVDTMAKIASALELTVEDLLAEADLPEAKIKRKVAQAEQSHNLEVAPASISVPSQSNMHKDLPVLGTAAGSHTNGVLSLEANIIEYVRRPPGVEAVKDAYAVYVEGDSMEPRYYAGDLIIAHPHRPPRIGDSVVVQFKRGETDYQEAIIGILHKRSGSKIEIEKLNPQNILNFDADNVIAIHRILSLNDLLGV
ncbi:XRE family transcriptional regulator [Bartonella sp. HY038]|uniref:XRE family transcriptional regulator n=1 Tax=Bartonella sp. HY038 TaxID=2759660 RepID=UPI0015FCA4EA|nr:S24 family peptidase [Bartonella sp. HY038]